MSCSTTTVPQVPEEMPGQGFRCMGPQNEGLCGGTGKDLHDAGAITAFKASDSLHGK